MNIDRFRSCGSQGAHRPHSHYWRDRSWTCRGVLPIWPCPEAMTDEHDDHMVHGDDTTYYCPGVNEPPSDMTGPPYPDTEPDPEGT